MMLAVADRVIIIIAARNPLITLVFLPPFTPIKLPQGMTERTRAFTLLLSVLMRLANREALGRKTVT